MRVRNKTLRRQTRAIEVPARKANPRNVQLANDTTRNRLKTVIQNIDTIRRKRSANRDVYTVFDASHDMANRIDRRLGRTIKVCNSRDVDCSRNFLLQIRCENFSAQHQVIE